jgi:hypothetical protein
MRPSPSICPPEGKRTGRAADWRTTTPTVCAHASGLQPEANSLQEELMATRDAGAAAAEGRRENLFRAKAENGSCALSGTRRHRGLRTQTPREPPAKRRTGPVPWSRAPREFSSKVVLFSTGGCRQGAGAGSSRRSEGSALDVVGYALDAVRGYRGCTVFVDVSEPNDWSLVAQR